jgi:hypothetical protein
VVPGRGGDGGGGDRRVCGVVPGTAMKVEEERDGDGDGGEEQGGLVPGRGGVG